jgi:hypothetical protein
MARDEMFRVERGVVAVRGISLPHDCVHAGEVLRVDEYVEIDG